MGEYSTYDGQLIRYALDSRQYALKNGHNDLKSVLSLSSHNERLPLSRVEDGTICGGLVEKVRHKLGYMVRRQICLVERGVLAEGQDGVLELHADDVDSRVGELASRGGGGNGRCQYESLERSQADSLYEPEQVEVTECLPFASIDPISKAVC